MKNLKYGPSGLFSNLLIIFFIFGCVGKTIKADLPSNHPTNPDAQEAEFIPPPNPFHTDFTVMEEKSETDSMHKHKMHKEDSQPHTDHNMGTEKENQSDSELKMKPEHQKGDHQHKGHSQ